MTDLTHIEDFIQKAHAGQKYGSDDYYSGHLYTVAAYAERVARNLGTAVDMEIAYIVGLAHDLLEDHAEVFPAFKELLRDTIGASKAETVESAIYHLTHGVEEDYADYIFRVGESKSIIALIVKYADLHANIEKSQSTGGKFKKLPLYKFAYRYIKEQLINNIL